MAYEYSAGYNYQHISEPDVIDLSQSNGELVKFAKWIRTRGYGIDVREALARSDEQIGVLFKQYENENSKNRYDMELLKKEFDQAIHGLTRDSEVIDARVDQNGKTYETLGQRLNNEQLNSLSIGQVVGGDDSEHTVQVIGLTENSAGIHFQQVGVDEPTDKITGGFETIRKNQLRFEEVKR